MRYLIDTNVFIKIIKDYDIFDDIKNILENYLKSASKKLGGLQGNTY